MGNKTCSMNIVLKTIHILQLNKFCIIELFKIAPHEVAKVIL